MSYFFRSILCISPKQAGLSVLKSMGYGVPFVTRKDAITGGEINNIMDGVNGIFYHSLNELADVIIDVRCHPENFKRMSENARTYYLQNASIEKMAHGFIDATNFVQKKQDMPD